MVTYTTLAGPCIVADVMAGIRSRTHLAPVPSGTVLVVDDDEDIRETMALVLREDGFLVEEAANGLEALALLRSHPGGVRLIFLDLAMPGMDGRAFLTAKGADPLIVNVPVVVISGDPDERVGPAGAVRQYLTKPVSLAGLLLAANSPSPSR